MFLKTLAAAAATLACATSAAAEPDGIAINGTVGLAYWVRGNDTGTPLLILNGQGAATRPEGDGLITALVAQGFRVILFDNRDSGQSTVLRAAGAPPGWDEIADTLAAGGVPALAYDLADMADDTVAVLDAVGIDRAHVLGHSMGGMIAQVLAAEHPDRVLSLISVSASSGDPELPFGPAMAAMTGMEQVPSESPAQLLTRAYRIFEGDAALRMGDAEVTARVAADLAVDDPNAALRQGAAAAASGDRSTLLQEIAVPALVIHGRDDPWFPISHAEQLSTALAGAPVEIIAGMGHILSDPAAPIVAASVARFVGCVSVR